jgi:hypothetical protein
MLSITFDIVSEMAGPVVVPLTGSPPFQLTGLTDLTGPSGTIGSDHILVRLLGDRLMLSLRDLKGQNLAAGAYSGSLTLLDGDNGENNLPVTATCKNTLWWR